MLSTNVIEYNRGSPFVLFHIAKVDYLPTPPLLFNEGIQY